MNIIKYNIEVIQETENKDNSSPTPILVGIIGDRLERFLEDLLSAYGQTSQVTVDIKSVEHH